MVKVAIAGFHHASIGDGITGWDAFVAADDRPGLTIGDALFDVMPGLPLAISGFMAEAGRRGQALIPLGWAAAAPGGPVTSDAFERLSALLIGELTRQEPIDALYLDLHGAMSAPPFPNAEGELLRRCRAVLARPAPIVASLDFRADVTPTMRHEADLLVAFPGDARETGALAARWLDDWLRGGARPGKALRRLAFTIETEAELRRRCVAIEGDTVLSVTRGVSSADISVLAYAATQEDAEAAADARLVGLEFTR